MVVVDRQRAEASEREQVDQEPSRQPLPLDLPSQLQRHARRKTVTPGAPFPALLNSSTHGLQLFSADAMSESVSLPSPLSTRKGACSWLVVELTLCCLSCLPGLLQQVDRHPVHVAVSLVPSVWRRRASSRLAGLGRRLWPVAPVGCWRARPLDVRRRWPEHERPLQRCVPVDEQQSILEHSVPLASTEVRRGLRRRRARAIPACTFSCGDDAARAVKH